MRARPSGRTGHLGGGVDDMIVINGEDADEARLVAADAAAAAADAAAVAVYWLPPSLPEPHDEPPTSKDERVSNFTINIIKMRS